jgi:hypothetical protein
MENRTITYEFSGRCGIESSGLRTDSMHDNVRETAGTKQITDFVKLVRSALQAASPDNIAMTLFETMFETSGAGGEINGYFLAVFTERLTIASNPLL